MTALHPQPSATTSPDVAQLAGEFRATVLPAAKDFLKREISANTLRDRWGPYYYDIFHPFDLNVEQAWRSATDTDGKLESGPPAADPNHELPLKLFPVSIAHNNLDRLIEVLAGELGDGTAEATKVPERIVDFAHVVDALNELLTSLAE
ncbi:MAG TPA: hypothetical protein VFU43_28040 [Streptosporangiaceae bacterium]|nr:hypothetical protein [Streptosporangiaceae bacterium]